MLSIDASINAGSISTISLIKQIIRKIKNYFVKPKDIEVSKKSLIVIPDPSVNIETFKDRFGKVFLNIGFTFVCRSKLSSTGNYINEYYYHNPSIDPDIVYNNILKISKFFIIENDYRIKIETSDKENFICLKILNKFDFKLYSVRIYILITLLFLSGYALSGFFI